MCHELCVITVDIIDDNHDCELQGNSLHGDDEYGDQSDEVQFTEDDVTLLDFDELKSNCEPLEELCSSPSAENSYITSNSQDGVASDISSGVAQPPIPPKLHSFPATHFSSKACCFKNEWYEKYSWLNTRFKRILYSVIHAGFSHYLAQPELKKIFNQLDIGTGNTQLEKTELLRSMISASHTTRLCFNG